MKAYTHEKYQRRRNFFTRVKLYFASTFFLALFAGVLYGMFFSPWVTDISYSIEGSEAISRQDFDTLAPSIFGFHLPQNIILFRINKAEKLILDNYPQLASVAVSKDITARIILVEAVERKKEIIWCTAPQCWWIDRDGVVLDSAPDAIGLLIIKITDDTGETFTVGDRVLERVDIETIIGFSELLKEHSLWWGSLVLKSRQSQEVLIELTNGVRIRLGLRSVSADLYDAFIAAAQDLELDSIDYFDLTVENRIYYKSR